FSLNDTSTSGIYTLSLHDALPIWDREEVVMIGPLESGLVLYKLRYPKELRAIDAVPQIEPKEANKDELKLSISLVESMSSSLKRSEEHTSELQSLAYLVCRLLLEK